MLEHNGLWWSPEVLFRWIFFGHLRRWKCQVCLLPWSSSPVNQSARVCVCLGNMQWRTKDKNVLKVEKLTQKESGSRSFRCRVPNITSSWSLPEAQSARLGRLGQWCTKKPLCGGCSQRGAEQRKRDSNREKRWGAQVFRIVGSGCICSHVNPR